MSKTNKYIDIKNNGRIFPVWIAHNFNEYRLHKIIVDGDPCAPVGPVENKTLHQYQAFVGKYLGPQSPYNEILLYHGMGSGKTVLCINLINLLYTVETGINIIILIKASLKDDPWMKDIKKWLEVDENEKNIPMEKTRKFKSINFVHYDSPFADKSFMDVIRDISTGEFAESRTRTLYLIDEAHNFIRNVYSNINSKTGKRAQVIYDYIIKDRKENIGNKLVLMSATPAINEPFEFSLIFNMLRPGIFPMNEMEFNSLYVTDSAYPILNPTRRNMFQRRILGLISYYIGATPDKYAKSEYMYVDLEMSEYQYNVYKFYEEVEAKFENSGRGGKKKQSKLYKTYTRQACNFAFPPTNVTSGETRPRPNKFKLNDNVVEKLEKGRLDKARELNKPENNVDLERYLRTLNEWTAATEEYFMKMNRDELMKEVDEFKKYYDDPKSEKRKFKVYHKTSKHCSLYDKMYECSPKMLAICFYTCVSPGKTYIYSNYVKMEGIELMKVYLRVFGFNNYTTSKPFKGYCEYHGMIEQEERKKIKNAYNEKNNYLGEYCKVLLLSPSGAEGINLLNIRQLHILEPYWNEVRIIQITGRGLRYCSHVDLPVDQRNMMIFRYKMLKPEANREKDSVPLTADQMVDDRAKSKQQLFESFYTSMREAAVDCDLYREHNMMSNRYNCFQFEEGVVMSKNPGPAYKDDIKDDIKYDNGLNRVQSYVESIKVIKIKGIYIVEAGKDPIYSLPRDYWMYPENGMVYDFIMKYPVGRVKMVDDVPEKFDNNTYIISDVIKIPSIN